MPLAASLKAPIKETKEAPAAPSGARRRPRLSTKGARPEEQPISSPSCLGDPLKSSACPSASLLTWHQSSLALSCREEYRDNLRLSTLTLGRPCP